MSWELFIAVKWKIYFFFAERTANVPGRASNQVSLTETMTFGKRVRRKD